MANFKFKLSQRVVIPAEIGKGIQGLVSGRSEYLTGEIIYQVSWLSPKLEMHQKNFGEMVLLEAQASVIDFAHEIVARLKAKTRTPRKSKSRSRNSRKPKR